MIARMYPDFSCITYFAPLYLYPDPNDKKLFADDGPWPAGKDGRVPNLNPAFVQDMAARLGLRFVPESDLTPRPPLHSMERGSQQPAHPSSPSPLVERGLGGEVLDQTGLGGEVRDSSPELWEMLKPLARQMRREPTQAENHLWQQLRNRQVAGAKFRRQHAIDRFIVDFYCSEAGLIVEVDGPIHDYTPDEDAVRQEFLETVGYRVLRFTNDQVLNATKDVLETISAALVSPSSDAADRSQPTRVSSPSPRVERGAGGEVNNTFTPEDIFHYAYAIFHSPTYRERYAEFLRIDFPRLPLTSDVELFHPLVEKGRELVNLHLVRHPRQRSITGLITQYAGTGSDTVERGFPEYVPNPVDSPRPEGEGQGVRASGRVFINKTKYFEGVEPDDWDFHIGGYQVLEKWLKDRRGRALSGDDILHYQRIVLALRETRRLMDEIDDLIPAWPIT